MSQPPKIQVDPLSRRPFVPLPSPFERYRLTLSDRSLNAPSITSILSIPSIAGNLSSVPEPYTLRDAEYWLSLPPQGNDEARYLRQGIDWHDEDTVREQLKERIPFCVIRDSENGELVGSVSVRRNNWEWLNSSKEANVERERLVKMNEALVPGDPEICYSIGTSRPLLSILSVANAHIVRYTCKRESRLLPLPYSTRKRNNDSSCQSLSGTSREIHECS